VFHVSQLKVAVLVTHTAQPLPSSLDGLQVPERVLQKRVTKVGTDVRLQALIQWSGMPSALATWEDMETLRQCFSRAPAWGQAGSYRGGDVSSRTSTPSSLEENEDDIGHTDLYDNNQVGRGPRRGECIHRPNIRVHGLERK